LRFFPELEKYYESFSSSHQGPNPIAPDLYVALMLYEYRLMKRRVELAISLDVTTSLRLGMKTR
jgi:hypothetical protein